MITCLQRTSPSPRHQPRAERNQGESAIQTKRTPYATKHLMLMGLLMAINVFFIVAIAFIPSVAAQQGVVVPASLYGFLGASALNILAFGCGIKYIMSGYSKAGATYYKGFMMLLALAYACSGITTTIMTGFGASPAMLFVKVLVLLSLAFLQDLGEDYTWVFFFTLVGVDFASAPLFGELEGTLLYAVIVLVARILIDTSIILAIGGKYADKDARGTV